jgi:hypothetical protein
MYRAYRETLSRASRFDNAIVTNPKCGFLSLGGA